MDGHRGGVPAHLGYGDYGADYMLQQATYRIVVAVVVVETTATTTT